MTYIFFSGKQPGIETFKSRIVGGIEAERGEFPYAVSIQTNYLGTVRHVCGGAIVSESWIITTAFCVKGIYGDIWIKAGLNNLINPENSMQTLKVVKTVSHPDYPSTP